MQGHLQLQFCGSADINLQRRWLSSALSSSPVIWAMQRDMGGEEADTIVHIDWERLA
jgi:hypothetical protein